MASKTRAMLWIFFASLLLSGCTASIAAAESEFRWQVNKATLLEAEKETIIATAVKVKFVLETKVVGVKVKIECEGAIPAADIEGGKKEAGKPGLSAITLELIKCGVKEPAGCEASFEAMKMTGEIMEIGDAGLATHNSVLFTITGEPKLKMKGKECEFSTQVTGTLAVVIMPDKTEQKELKLEFETLTKLKNVKKEEVKAPNLKVFGTEKSTLTGEMIGIPMNKVNWGIF